LIAVWDLGFVIWDLFIFCTWDLESVSLVLPGLYTLQFLLPFFYFLFPFSGGMCFEIWDLEFGICLSIGAWDLGFVI